MLRNFSWEVCCIKTMTNQTSSSTTTSSTSGNNNIAVVNNPNNASNQTTAKVSPTAESRFNWLNKQIKKDTFLLCRVRTEDIPEIGHMEFKCIEIKSTLKRFVFTYNNQKFDNQQAVVTAMLADKDIKLSRSIRGWKYTEVLLCKTMNFEKPKEWVVWELVIPSAFRTSFRKKSADVCDETGSKKDLRRKLTDSAASEHSAKRLKKESRKKLKGDKRDTLNDAVGVLLTCPFQSNDMTNLLGQSVMRLGMVHCVLSSDEDKAIKLNKVIKKFNERWEKRMRAKKRKEKDSGSEDGDEVDETSSSVAGPENQNVKPSAANIEHP